jgi:hypothetical protein
MLFRIIDYNMSRVQKRINELLTRFIVRATVHNNEFMEIEISITYSEFKDLLACIGATQSVTLPKPFSGKQIITLCMINGVAKESISWTTTDLHYHTRQIIPIYEEKGVFALGYCIQ